MSLESQYNVLVLLLAVSNNTHSRSYISSQCCQNLDVEHALGRHGEPHVLRGVGVSVLTVALSCHVLGILDAVVVFGVELNWCHTTVGIASL